MRIQIKFFIVFLCLLGSLNSYALTPQKNKASHVILFIWDGLRPDAISEKNTPHLYELMQRGVYFQDNHSSYPTLTMINAASFATGHRAGKTGFYGNTLWHPGLAGMDSANKPIDFSQPVMTEDYKILQALDKDHLFFVNTLFKTAQENGLATSTIGKTGPAFLQDYLSKGIVFDEKHVSPLSFAKNLQKDHYALPDLAPYNYSDNELILDPSNGKPTSHHKTFFLDDNVTSDASDTHGSPYNQANQYMIKVYLNEILAKKLPPLSVIWMRNPDTTEHRYGPGTSNYYSALHSNDKILAKLIDALKKQHLDTETDIIIASDHSHSTVSGPFDLFPLRTISNKKVGEISAVGFSVSGEVRTADLLTQAGFKAYDGEGCGYNPVLSGIKRDGTPAHQVLEDKTGTICGSAGAKYITPAYYVPATLPKDGVVIASNGGSVYFYIPSHDKNLVQKLVTTLASHNQYGAIFVDHTRYGYVAGSLSTDAINLQNTQGRTPDVIASLSYDPEAKVQGIPGTEFSDGVNTRGSHGTFGPNDVHNVLLAAGPDFKVGQVSTLPSGNVDVPATIAYLLGLDLPDTEGRILYEGLVSSDDEYRSEEVIITSREINNLPIYNVLNELLTSSTFMTKLHTKILTHKQDGKKYLYFDYAEGIRR